MKNDFAEYMWYLLTSPLKKVKKSLNAWYILCKVFGRRLDRQKEAIFRARDEGMVATCCQEMLPIHGADRNLTRYAGEHPENFRIRIAKYEEVCRLGGTNEGIILAVRSLGFGEVELITAPKLKGDMSRWAEFYLILPMDMETLYPINMQILRKEVRKVKEVGAKENYLIRVTGKFEEEDIAALERIRMLFQLRWYDNVLWNGTVSWNGEYQWNSIENSHPVKMVLNLKQELQFVHHIELFQKYHYRTWDGESTWNGEKMWDAEINKEVL